MFNKVTREIEVKHNEIGIIEKEGQVEISCVEARRTTPLDLEKLKSGRNLGNQTRFLGIYTKELIKNLRNNMLQEKPLLTSNCMRNYYCIFPHRIYSLLMEITVCPTLLKEQIYVIGANDNLLRRYIMHNS